MQNKTERNFDFDFLYKYSLTQHALILHAIKIQGKLLHFPIYWILNSKPERLYTNILPLCNVEETFYKQKKKKP